MNKAPMSRASHESAHGASSFAQDADEKPASLASEVLRLLDTDEKRQWARELARAALDHPDVTRISKSLAELDALLSGDAVTRCSPSLPSQQSSVEELVTATHHVAELAIKTAAALPRREVRSQCMRLAMHCATDASRLKRQLLWPDL
jgi:hypothetical protein